MMAEHLALGLMADMDIIAPRHGYACVSINEEPYGLYGVVETMDEQMVSMDKQMKKNMDKVKNCNEVIDEDITQDGVVVVIDEEPAVPAALDPSITGESIFLQNCVACHGADMTGGVGPNLIDDEWIHGGDLPTITRIITEGVPEKGMISWGPILGEQKIELVAQYVHSKTAE